MQITNGEVWQARDALEGLLKEPWPVKTAYALARLGRRLREQHAVIDEVRAKLIRQYGSADEQGQISVSFDNPQWSTLLAEINDLMALPVEIALEPVVLPATEVQLTPASLLALLPFVEVADE